MEQLTLGFIGGGNMATAILRGILNQNYLPSHSISLSEPNIDSNHPVAGTGVFTSQDNREVATRSQVLLLAVKPQVMPQVLQGISDLTSGKCVISIAAGISVATLQEALPDAKVIRVMPNTPLMVGRGATAIARTKAVSESLFSFVEGIFASSGEVALIDEGQMDDILSVNGSSPAWFFHMAEVMVARAVSAGIEEQDAIRLIGRTMEGAGKMIVEGNLTPSALKSQVCSPGGTTLASLTAFEEMGFESLMLEAMKRCTQRSRELGQ